MRISLRLLLVACLAAGALLGLRMRPEPKRIVPLSSLMRLGDDIVFGAEKDDLVEQLGPAVVLPAGPRANGCGDTRITVDGTHYDFSPRALDPNYEHSVFLARTEEGDIRWVVLRRPGAPSAPSVSLPQP